MNVTTTIPVMFQKLNEYEVDDTRFMPVKIWLMHTQENLNGSYFEKSIVEEAIPSLANVPILGYIEVNSENEDDFSDHRNILVKENGRYKIKYIGQAFGVIPESNNAHFEKRLCDDGIEREFLVCEGLIWTKWEEPINIFNRDVVKSQSIELADNYKGYFDDNDNLFHFTSFQFFGACVLGLNVQPAMINSTIEQFSYENIFKDIHCKVEQYKSYISSQSFNDDVDIDSNEGGQEMTEVEKMLDKYSISKEVLLKYDSNIDFAKITPEDLETKISEYFALTNKQLRQQFNEVSQEQTYTDDWGEWRRYWYFDHNESVVWFEDGANNYNIYKFTYSMNGDNVVVDWESGIKQKYVLEDWDNGVETEFQFTDIIADKLNVVTDQLTADFAKEKDDLIKNYDSKLEDYKAQLTDSNAKFKTLQQENETLKEFKVAKEQEERQQAEDVLFEQFAKKLSEDELAEFKEIAKDLSIEELEKELFVAVGKKAVNFTVKPTKQKNVTVKVEKEDMVSKPNKSWVSIVENYS